MAKIHLVQSQTPLTEGRDQDAMCGKTVKNARIGTMFDGTDFGGLDATGFREELWGNVNFCRNCLQEEWRTRYIYAVREG